MLNQYNLQQSQFLMLKNYIHKESNALSKFMQLYQHNIERYGLLFSCFYCHQNQTYFSYLNDYQLNSKNEYQVGLRKRILNIQFLKMELICIYLRQYDIKQHITELSKQFMMQSHQKNNQIPKVSAPIKNQEPIPKNKPKLEKIKQEKKSLINEQVKIEKLQDKKVSPAVNSINKGIQNLFINIKLKEKQNKKQQRVKMEQEIIKSDDDEDYYRPKTEQNYKENINISQIPKQVQTIKQANKAQIVQQNLKVEQLAKEQDEEEQELLFLLAQKKLDDEKLKNQQKIMKQKQQAMKIQMKKKQLAKKPNPAVKGQNTLINFFKK